MFYMYYTSQSSNLYHLSLKPYSYEQILQFCLYIQICQYVIKPYYEKVYSRIPCITA